jgi:hypothetical protein
VPGRVTIGSFEIHGRWLLGYDWMMPVQLVALLDERLESARFARLDRNPVLVAVDQHRRSPDSLDAVLLQYAFLPGVIAELLARGVVKLFRWQPVRDELLRNLGEELGSRSAGQTHFKILGDGLEREVGLVAGSLPANTATQAFIQALRTAISDLSDFEAAGALFALEDSAVPELRVVARIINKYGQARFGRLPVRETDLGIVVPSEGAWTLDRFLAAHIGDFEVGHRDYLAQTLMPFVSEPEQAELVQLGFDRVLTLMDEWWESLATS